MKPRVLSLVAIVMLICGCQKNSVPLNSASSSGHRLIKISFKGQHGSCRLRINRQPIERIRNSDFTNAMTRLHLEYGDIVVWEAEQNESGKELSWPETVKKWWYKHLETTQASFYSISSDRIEDFFATPIYHWKAKPERERPLPDSNFYVDGNSCGNGRLGFVAMLAAIDSQKSGEVFIVAPRIKNEGSASPWIASGQLTTWAEEAGVSARFEKILFGRYTDLTDFARLNDDG
jgi:hypothetical protein